MSGAPFRSDPPESGSAAPAGSEGAGEVEDTGVEASPEQGGSELPSPGDRPADDDTGPEAEETFAASESDPFGGLPGLDELLSDDLKKVAAERDEYLDALRRLQADFDNFRKRALRQQTETLERATEALVKQLLPVLDALDLAMAHASGGAAASDDEAAGGGDAGSSLIQIGSLLRDTLAREGLERIDEIGVLFDPTIHDAVAHEPAEAPAGNGDGGGDDEEESETEGVEETGARVASQSQGHPSVSEVLRAGYRMKGKVVRPAMVKVRG